MAAPRSVARSQSVAARRWDVLIVGSGISALVAATRLGMADQRVLVVEEDDAATAFAGLREPFFLAGANDQGAVDACLRDLMLPLIERRRIVEQELSLQVIGERLRLDLGEPGRSSSELVAWGLSKPDEAQAVVRVLLEAADAERQAMLGAAWVRIGRRANRPMPGTHGSHVRGLPAEAAKPSETLAPILDAGIRALSNLATHAPGPEARARLLGTLFQGGSGFEDPPPWLYGLLRKRAESVHVEFRKLRDPFEIIESEGEAGLHLPTGQLWLGRALVIAAPGAALAHFMAGSTAHATEGAEADADIITEVPDFLEASRGAGRRLAIHLRCRATAIPEAMARRLVLLPEPADDEIDPLGAVTLAIHPRTSHPEGSVSVDLIARAMLPGPLADEPGPAEHAAWLSVWEDRLEDRVRRVLPFAEKRLMRVPYARPRWDDDDLLEDPAPGRGWPAETDLRVSTRPPVYRLDRAAVAGLGVEGDLLLGWRGGDAIALEL